MREGMFLFPAEEGRKMRTLWLEEVPEPGRREKRIQIWVSAAAILLVLLGISMETRHSEKGVSSILPAETKLSADMSAGAVSERETVEYWIREYYGYN